MEDKFHSDKKNNSKLMNKIKFKFLNKKDFEYVKKNVYSVITNKTFLSKFNITTKSILSNNNYVFTVDIKNKKYAFDMYFNHYYMSGSYMFILLSIIVGSSKPKYLHTDIILGFIYLPLYIYKMWNLTKKKKIQNNDSNKIISKPEFIKNIITNHNKRYYLYHHIMKKTYQLLKLNRPMTVALTVAFYSVPNINNNVGIIIIEYTNEDTIETIKKKITDNYYQAIVSNCLLNCPLPNMTNFELRHYIDCTITANYIKNDLDLDFEFGWYCVKPPVEQVYIGSLSLLRSNDTFDINMVITTNNEL